MAEIIKVPRHVAIIPDGNRRWAKDKGLPAIEGHRQGYRNIKKIVKKAVELGVEYVSVYAFSTENWSRSKQEVSSLMVLLKWAAKNELRNIEKEDLRIRFAGSEHGLDPDVLQAIRKLEERTKNNKAGQFIVCVNYGGQKEIIDAVQSIVAKGFKPDEIDEKVINEHLYLPDIPPVDLLIRTSSEKRLSNFMPWQSAYAELMFPDKLWPDFTADDLEDCINEYAERRRRFGE